TSSSPQNFCEVTYSVISDEPSARTGRFLVRRTPPTHANTCYTPSVILGLGVSPMRRREFIALLGSGVAAWPLAAGAAQGTVPVVGFLRNSSPDASTNLLAALRRGLNEPGYIEGQNLAIEYRWSDDRSDRLGALAADLVRRQCALIVAAGNAAALAAKAA